MNKSYSNDDDKLFLFDLFSFQLLFGMCWIFIFIWLPFLWLFLLLISIHTAKAVYAGDFQLKNEPAQQIISIDLNSWTSSFLSRKSPAQTAFAGTVQKKVTPIAEKEPLIKVYIFPHGQPWYVLVLSSNVVQINFSIVNTNFGSSTYQHCTTQGQTFIVLKSKLVQAIPKLI